MRCVFASLLGGLKSLAKVRACDNRIGMRESWPHAPPHYFTPHGTCIITAATLHRAPLFGSGAKLDLLRDTTFELARNYALTLQALAFFSNHYHLVVSFENTAKAHRDVVRHLHGELALRLNRVDDTPRPRVRSDFRDPRLTSQNSCL